MSHNTLFMVCALLALRLFSLLPGGVTAHNDANTEAKKLLQQAEELTNIRSSGGHQFRLTARVQLSGSEGQVQEGTYSLLWESPTVWRDETNFKDFSQVRIAKGDKLYIVRKPWNLTKSSDCSNFLTSQAYFALREKQQHKNCENKTKMACERELLKLPFQASRHIKPSSWTVCIQFPLASNTKAHIPVINSRTMQDSMGINFHAV
jgi:hypothetical protein